MASVEWSGLDELGAALAKAVAESEGKVGQVIYNNAEQMSAKARSYAPVDTAFLKENITSKKTGNLSAEVESGAGYAGFQEWGTRYQTGTPHIKPSFDDQVPILEQQIRDVAGGLFK